MKVILLKDVRGVGQHGDVKQVADGYAVNFLFPQKAAEAATAEAIQKIEEHKKAQEESAKKEEEELNNKVSTLRGKKIVLSARATEKGGLFKTISAKDIARTVLAEYALEIPEESIHFAEPIKTVGEHIVHLAGSIQKAEFGVVIVPATT